MTEAGDDQSHARDTRAREAQPRKLSPEAEERRGESQRAYQRARRKTPEEKRARKEYAQRPEVQQRARERARRARATGRWASRHPEKEMARRLRAAYGIGIDVWNRIWREQGGLCAICRCAPATHVDHDHQTNLVRALLCNHCNTALGLFDDEPARLRAAADYLEHHAAQEAPYVQERLFDV